MISSDIFLSLVGSGIFQALFSGFLLGSLYAIMAMGLSLIWGSLRVLNFSHGALFMWGGYTTWFFLYSVGLDYSASFAIGIGTTFLVGIIMERCMIRPLRAYQGFEVTTIIATIALAISLEILALILFGPHTKQLPPVIKGNLELYGTPSYITLHQLVIIIIAVSTLGMLWFFLKTTKSGMALRAVSQHLTASQLMGIDINRVYLYTMGLGSAMAGIAGILLGSIYFIAPTVGEIPLLKAFIVVVFGGLGSLKGTIYGAFIIGVVEALAMFWLGLFWGLPILFLFMVIVLILRPRGLFG